MSLSHMAKVRLFCFNSIIVYLQFASLFWHSTLPQDTEHKGLALCPNKQFIGCAPCPFRNILSMCWQKSEISTYLKTHSDVFQGQMGGPWETGRGEWVLCDRIKGSSLYSSHGYSLTITHYYEQSNRCVVLTHSSHIHRRLFIACFSPATDH